MASSLPKLCFNSNCKQLLEAHSRKGWRRRTGEFADLCDRCGTAFEEGKFCETFHLNASGWRCCESCGKQIHCGCIVSFHMFVLLDAGGIECITCTRKSFILTPNPAWPPPSLIIPGLPERVKDLSVKKWSSIAASGPVPWRQAPSLFNPEVHPKMPLEVGISTGIDRVLDRERLSDSLDNSKKNLDLSGRFINGSLKGSTSQILENGISGSKCEKQPSPYVNVSKEAVLLKNGPSTPHLTLTLNPASKNEITMQSKVSESYAQQPTPPAGAKQFGSSNGVESSGEAPICNGRPRGDTRGRNQLLPRYWPKITDQELLQISGDTNTVITPLFEKMLTASDAGKIGRLVLPKKCAEAYLPPISNPEGMPLLVQDLKGQEWVFQFRFWPNNNSRMYVLEGVTSCIHSMQLQAGDTVTFSRLEPHGKLVIGCRKTSTPFDQSKESINTGNGVCAHRVVIAKTTRPDEVVTAHHQSKSNSVPCSLLATNKANLADSANKILKIDESKYIARETLEAKLDICSKRKSTTLGSQSKRLRIENEELIELKLTRGEAQGLLRPPPNDVPKIVAIEGYEIEEFEEPPIIGRPTIVATDSKGEVIQWVQCEDCFKWRKVPGYAIFPSRWTCSRNLYDPERSLCSADQELTIDELKLLLSAAEAKKKADKENPDSLEASEGLDALARLAIYEDGDSPASSSSQTTTKHPRHRLGCSCIVCIQTPSGKGPKHNLMSVTKQSEKEPKTAFQKPEQLGGEEIELCGHTTNNDQFKTKSSNSPFKCGIDLNIRPEREEHLSSILNPAGITRMLEHATQHYLEQQKISSSGGNSTVTQTHSSGTVEGNFTNKVPVLCTSQQNAKSSDFHPILLETKR